MESSSFLISLVSVVILASSVFPVSEAYTVDRADPCTRKFVRQMTIEMCSRHKRHSENEAKDSFSPSLTQSPTQVAKGKINPSILSSLDTLFFGLFGHSHELKDLISEQEVQRFERAENKLMRCCLQGNCTRIDFEEACS